MAKKPNVLFATFSPWHNNKRLPTNGMIEPILSFFLPKTEGFLMIDEPHPGSDRLIPLIEIYRRGKLVKKTRPFFLVYFLYPLLWARNSVGTRIPFKIRDFLTVFEVGLRSREKFDLFIGLESINAIAGIVLKKLGIVKTVIYYVSDYSPTRYKRGWFNQIYLYLDKLAAMHADFIWDVSPAIMPARIKAGLDKNKAAPVIHVPNALFPKQINYLPESKILPNTLIFAGTLGEENGPDLAIETLKIVAEKVSDAKLHIFGGGDSDIKRLTTLAQKLNLKDGVVFHGFVSDQIKLSNEIAKYAVGLAPYKAIPGSPRWWADATKIRLYLAAGLPVITTQVPPLGKEIEKDKAGIIAKDNPKDQANAIKKLLTDKVLYKQMRKNAIQRARNNTWYNTYSQALKKMVVLDHRK